MSAPVLVLLPTGIALYIPLIEFLNRSTAVLPERLALLPGLLQSEELLGRRGIGLHC